MAKINIKIPAFCIVIISCALFNHNTLFARSSDVQDSFQEASLCGNFVNMGKIYSINNKSVIINDAEYRIAPDAKIFSRHGTRISLSSIKKADVIKFAVHDGKICAIKKTGASFNEKNETAKRTTGKTRKLNGKYINY